MSPKALSWVFHVVLVIALILFFVYVFLVKDEKVEKGIKTALVVAGGVFLAISVGFIIWYYIAKNKQNKGMMGMNPMGMNPMGMNPMGMRSMGMYGM